MVKWRSNGQFLCFSRLTSDGGAKRSTIVALYDGNSSVRARLSHPDTNFVMRGLNKFVYGVQSMEEGVRVITELRSRLQETSLVLKSYRTGEWEGMRNDGPWHERRYPKFLDRSGTDRFYSDTMCPVCLDKIGQFSTVTKIHTGRWVHMDCWGQSYAQCHACENLGVGKVWSVNAMTCRDCMSVRRRRNYAVI